MTTRQVGYRLKSEGKEDVKRDLAEIGTAGKASGEAIKSSYVAAGTAIQQTGHYTDAEMARFKKMAAAAREFQTAQEQQAKFNAILGVRSDHQFAARSSDFLSADDVNAKAGKMTRAQRAGRLNLFRQGADVFTTGAMGMDPGMIAIQQLPQILDAAATSGFKASAAMVVLGTGVGVVAAAVATGAVAQDAYAASVLKLEISTRGLGAAAGMTADQLLEQAAAGADAGNITVKSARDMAAAYSDTGRIGGDVMADLIGLTKTYGLNTRQDAVSATKELGAAFADPAKGVVDLNAKLNFLSQAEQKHIQNLADAGDQAEAQRLMIDALRGSMLSATDATTGWAHAFSEIATQASNAFDRVGQVVDRMNGGGTAIERLTDSRAALKRLSGGGSWGAAIRASNEAEVDELYRDFVAEQDRLRQAAVNSRDRDRQSIVDRYSDPKIKALQDQQNARSIYLLTGGKEGDETVRKIDAEIKALKAGYSSAADQATKLGQSHRRALAESGRQVRAEAKDVREAASEMAELQRQKTAAADHALDQERKLATIRGDVSALDLLQREADYQQEINRYLAEGLDLEEARLRARQQIAAEMRAESDVLRQQRSNPEGFVSSADRLKGVEPRALDAYNAKTAFLTDLTQETSYALHDGLIAGLTGGDFLQVFQQRLQYAAATALADSLMKLDGSGGGGGSGLVSSIIQSGMSYFSNGTGAKLTADANFLTANNAKFAAAGFAKGTESAPEGWAWVGEEGPELRKLRAGDQIRTHRTSMDMVRRSVAAPSPTGGGRVELHNHGAPMKAVASTTADGASRVDLYDEVGRDLIDRAGRTGDLKRAADKGPRLKRYG